MGFAHLPHIILKVSHIQLVVDRIELNSAATIYNELRQMQKELETSLFPEMIMKTANCVKHKFLIIIIISSSSSSTVM